MIKCPKCKQQTARIVQSTYHIAQCQCGYKWRADKTCPHVPGARCELLDPDCDVCVYRAGLGIIPVILPGKGKDDE